MPQLLDLGCVLTFVLLLSAIESTHQQILFCPKPDGYDLTNITIPGSTWQFSQRGQCIDDPNIANNCTFSFALCSPLPTEAECANSSVCQVSPYTNKTELGHYVSNPFVKKDVNGFYAVFNRTEPIVNRWNRTCQLSIVLDFECNKNVPWISTGSVNESPEPTGFQAITENNCEMVVRFDYAGACYRIIPVTTTSPAPDTHRDSLSAGSVLLIL